MTVTDSHTLLHRLARIRTAPFGLFPESLYRDYRSGSMSYLSHAYITPNDYVLGVVSYTTNLNTPNLLRQMASAPLQSTSSSPLRILLETDAPYMIPANIYPSLTAPAMKGKRLPLCHSGMIPWTADFVAEVINEPGVSTKEAGPGHGGWDAAKVMQVARDNAKAIYGV